MLGLERGGGRRWQRAGSGHGNMGGDSEGCDVSVHRIPPSDTYIALFLEQAQQGALRGQKPEVERFVGPSETQQLHLHDILKRNSRFF